MSSLNELLKKLEVFSASENHEEVFESSYEILKSSPQDERALRLTIVSLINLDQYLKAFKILAKFNSVDHSGILLEKLYIYYKLDLNKELYQEFEKLSDDDLSRGLLHLKAQFYYRTGRFEEALKIYHNILADTSSSNPELLDLSVNERAILSDALQINSSSGISTTPKTSLVEESYDLLFNESLIQLSLSNHSKALEFLERAEQLAKNINETQQEQFNETLPILLQKAFIYQLINEEQKSQEILESLQQHEITDGLNKLILNNNYIALSGSIDSHLAYKELSFPNSINDLSARLSIVQKSQLIKNYLKLSLKIGKSNKPQKDLLSFDKTSRTLNALLKSSVLLDQDDLETQSQKAFKYAKNSKSIETALLAAQLSINANNIHRAINALESLSIEQRLIPGVASVLLGLYEYIHSNSKKVELFTQVYDYYSENSQLFKQNFDIFEFLKIFSFKFWELDTERSKTLLKDLNDHHKDPLISIVLNDEESTGLKSVNSLTSSLDLEELIKEGIAIISKETVVIKPTSHKITKRRVQKSKRVLKDFDANKQPDPERWLPLKDRSYYKSKKGKKNKSKEIQTQGGSADNTTEENLVSKFRQSTPQPKKSKKKGRK